MVDIAPRGIVFERKITTGNLLTIFGGVVFAATLLIAIGSMWGNLSSRLDNIECSLASAGIMATTTSCTFLRKAER